jgi:hypothetical protein
MIVPENVERVVEPMANSNLCSWWRQRIIGPQELDEGVIKSNGRVVMDLTRSLKAEDVFKIKTKRRAVNVIKAFGVGKALIMLVDIGLFEVSVRIVDC